MKKTTGILLLVLALVALTAVAASAHCGSCGTKHKHLKAGKDLAAAAASHAAMKAPGKCCQKAAVAGKGCFAQALRLLFVSGRGVFVSILDTPVPGS